MANLFSRFPSWLYGGLGLQEPRLPTYLEDSIVQPVLDVFQQGWGPMEWAFQGVTVGASQAAGTAVVLAPDVNLTRIILAVEIRNDTAAAGTFTPRIRDFTLNKSVSLEAIAIAANSVATADLVHKNLYPLVLPQGLRYEVGHPATGVGESLEFKVIRGQTRAGFKVL